MVYAIVETANHGKATVKIDAATYAKLRETAAETEDR